MYFSDIFLKRIYGIGLLIVIILLLLDLLAYFFYPGTVFYDIFLATREQTPLTWVSSLALLFIALSAFTAYTDSKKKVWYFLAIIFFFFSMDDAVYLHERISGFFVDNTSFLSFFPSYTWTLIYFPMLAFSLGAFIWLVWKDSPLASYRKTILLALAILGFAIFLDLLDGFVKKSPDLVFCFEQRCNLTVLHIMRLVEEVSEAIALGMLGYVNIKEHCIIRREKVG